MIGYTGEELQSLGPLDITHEDDRGTAQDMLEHVQSGKPEDYQSEKRYRCRDGRVIWVRVSTARALDPDTPLPGTPAIIEDITERKRAEGDLHNAREALSRATRLAMMGELAASIAHEVNQPLGAIIMNGNACRRFLALTPPDLDEIRDGLDAVVSDGNRASEVLSRIRAMLKNAAPERGEVDVNKTITEVLALTRQELQQHRVSVQVDLRPDLPRIVADRVQLQQVVLNLVMNGIDAMRAVADRARILTIRSQLDDQRNIVVNVADSGVGLDAADRERIFETFFTTKAAGMGMGLAISKSIIEAHHGRLWAAPGSPIGAMFAFALPSASGVSL